MTNGRASEWRPEGVRAAYDQVAEGYAEDFFDELDKYDFDRERIDEFAAACSGRALDVGCGPGHIARYLADRGVDVGGVDYSPGMVEVARQLNPHLPFDVGDMRALEIVDGALGGIVARYSLIHIPRDEVPAVLREFRRALVPSGALLLVVHVGTGEVHTDEFRGSTVSLDATLFERDELLALIEDAGFMVVKIEQREPAPEEFQAEKLSILATAAG